MNSKVASTMSLIGRTLGLSKLAKAGIVAGVVAAVYLTCTLYSWYRLCHIPGPFWAGFSRYWSLRELVKGRQPSAFKEANDKYGEYFFTWQNYVSEDFDSVPRIPRACRPK